MPKVRALSIGTSKKLDAHSQSLETFRPPPTHVLTSIVGIAISGSNDHVFVWYADGLFSEGSSVNLVRYRSPQPYRLPPGKTPRDIVGIDIAGSSNRVYTWYSDGTFSIGTTSDLDAHAPPQPYVLPAGKTPADIMGIGIAKSNDHVYTWYRDRTVSEGRSHDLGHYEAPQPFTLPNGYDVRDVTSIAIAGSNDHVYTWYKRMARGLGPASVIHDVDETVLAFMEQRHIPGMTVAVIKDGRGIVARGYGFSNVEANETMSHKDRSRIGSVSKVIAALAWMKVTEQQPALSEQTPVYGPNGVLKDPSYMTAAYHGVLRFTPVVGMAIAKSNDHVYTWYDNGTVSEGTSHELDRYSPPRSYSLPPGKTPHDIRTIAIGPGDVVHVWYDDGSVSRGTSRNLDAHHYEEKKSNDPDTPENERSGYHDGRLLRILAKAIAGSNGHVYTWYDDGTVTEGTILDPDAYGREEFSPASRKSRYDIRGIAIAGSNDHVYTWYTDGTMSEGTSRDLGKYSPTGAYSLAAGIDPAQRWETWYGSMTVAHLLTHSAGFTRSGDGPGAKAMFGVSDDELTYEHVHKYMLRTRKLLFAPGTRSKYSNHGMGLVGHLVAVATGRPYHEFVAQHLLAPVSLANPADGIVPLELASGPFVSALHERNPDGSFDTRVPAPTGHVRPQLAAGGWTASAWGLVRLLRATDQRGPDILQPATLQRMEAPYFAHIPGRGLGWSVNRQSSGAIKVAHDGKRGDGTAYMAKFSTGYRLPSGTEVGGFSVAVCANIGIEGSLVGLTDAIVEIVATASISNFYDFFMQVVGSGGSGPER